MRSTSAPTPQAVPIVFVVEDDVSVRESLELLSRCASWQAETFASAREFLSRREPWRRAASCSTWAFLTSVVSICKRSWRGELGISEITVKAHRGRVMRKRKAGSLADLVNMAARLHLS